MTRAIASGIVACLELANNVLVLESPDRCACIMQLQTHGRHPCVVARSAVLSTLLLAIAFAGGCSATQPSPQPEQGTVPPEIPAGLRILATGLVRYEVIPDFVTGYLVELTDPDGRRHQGFFDDPRTGPTPPGTTILGDVPTRVSPGRYQIRFTMERVTDQPSMEPVPGGTPRVVNERMTSCDSTFDAKPGADLIITAHFTIKVPDGGPPEGTCRVEIAATPNAS
jgi:hypothetical protein